MDKDKDIACNVNRGLFFENESETANLIREFDSVNYKNLWGNVYLFVIAPKQGREGIKPPTYFTRDEDLQKRELELQEFKTILGLPIIATNARQEIGQQKQVAVNSIGELLIATKRFFDEVATKAINAWVIHIGHGSRNGLMFENGPDMTLVDYVEKVRNICFNARGRAFSQGDTRELLPLRTQIVLGSCFSHLFEADAVDDGIYVHSLATADEPTPTCSYNFTRIGTRNIFSNSSNLELNKLAEKLSKKAITSGFNNIATLSTAQSGPRSDSAESENDEDRTTTRNKRGKINRRNNSDSDSNELEHKTQSQQRGLFRRTMLGCVSGSETSLQSTRGGFFQNPFRRLRSRARGQSSRHESGNQCEFENDCEASEGKKAELAIAPLTETPTATSKAVHKRRFGIFKKSSKHDRHVDHTAFHQPEDIKEDQAIALPGTAVSNSSRSQSSQHSAIIHQPSNGNASPAPSLLQTHVLEDGQRVLSLPFSEMQSGLELQHQVRPGENDLSTETEHEKEKRYLLG